MRMQSDVIYIKWEKKFEIGIPVIDGQHKILVEMCNDLYLALVIHRTNGSEIIDDSLRDALHRAVDYVKEHFSSEEKLMIKAGYKNYEEHRKQHDIFIAKILKTAKDFEKSPLSLAMQLVKFIYDWILEHIAFEDRQYVDSVLAYAKKLKGVA